MGVQFPSQQQKRASLDSPCPKTGWREGEGWRKGLGRSAGAAAGAVCSGLGAC